MDANDSWWVSQLLAAGCKKSVAPPMMDTVPRWYDRPYEMKDKDEEKRMEVEHQELVRHVIKCASILSSNI